MPVNQERLKLFSEAYFKGLTEAYKKYPKDYAWPESEIPKVHAKMVASLEKGDYNHNSHGFRLACKALGIKHTRKAITAFLTGEG